MKSVTVTFDFTPYAHQRYAHQLRMAVRFVVLVWHRRAGKTVFAVMELLLAAVDCKKERGRFGYIAPLLKQAKTVAWDYLKAFARKIEGCTINESELQVELPGNEARIRLYGADNPDTLRGIYLDGVVVDELADMKPEMWGEILRPALTDREGWALFIGTPKGINLLSELFYKALKQDEPDWAADLKRASETGVLSAAELEQAKREMTPAQYAQEMECDFAASVEDVLMRLDEVLAAQARTIPEAEFIYAPKILGVDVARYGGDSTVMVLRQGPMCFRPRVVKGLDTMAVAAQLVQLIDKHQPDATMLDIGGIGAGVFDRALQLGFDVVSVDFGSRPTSERFENKRAEMWWTLADWVRAGACLPDIQRLAQDLTAPRYTYANHRGKLQLESKDDMRDRGLPSPDYGDALACTFAFPVARRDGHSGARQRSIHDFDPYAKREPRPDVLHEFDPYGR